MRTYSLFAIFITVLLSCAKPKQPEFRRLESFNVKKLGLTQVDIGFRVTYFNPNNFGVSVKEAAADVYIDSVYVGKFLQDNEVSVNKQAEFSIPLTGSISLASALKLKSADISTKEFLLRANGSVKVGKAGVFVSRPFTYSGKQKLDLKL